MCSTQPKAWFGKAACAMEISSLFQAFSFSANEKTLSHTLQGYWGNFAYNGSPNGPGLVGWEAYNATIDNWYVFGRESATCEKQSQATAGCPGTTTNHRRQQGQLRLLGQLGLRASSAIGCPCALRHDANTCSCCKSKRISPFDVECVFMSLVQILRVK